VELSLSFLPQKFHIIILLCILGPRVDVYCACGPPSRQTDVVVVGIQCLRHGGIEWDIDGLTAAGCGTVQKGLLLLLLVQSSWLFCLFARVAMINRSCFAKPTMKYRHSIAQRCKIKGTLYKLIKVRAKSSCELYLVTGCAMRRLTFCRAI